MSKSIRKPIANIEGYNPSPAEEDRIPILNYNTGVKGETTYKDLGISLMGSVDIPASTTITLSSVLDSITVRDNTTGGINIFSAKLEATPSDSASVIAEDINTNGVSLTEDPDPIANFSVVSDGDELTFTSSYGANVSVKLSSDPTFTDLEGSNRAATDGDYVATFEQDLSSTKQEQARANIGVSPSLREVVNVGPSGHTFTDEDSGKIFVPTDDTNIDLPNTISTGFEVLIVSPLGFQVELSASGTSAINGGITTGVVVDGEVVTRVVKVGSGQWAVSGNLS